MKDFKLPIEIDFNFLRISQESVILKIRWNGLFLIIFQKSFFHHLENQTRVQETTIRAIWLPCEVRTPLAYVSAFNILLKDLNLHL